MQPDTRNHRPAGLIQKPTIMRQRTRSRPTDRPPVRRGVILPIMALVIVALVAFLALAIDLGMLAIAKTQAQQSADLASS